MDHKITITIDGPAGVGKSTLGRRLAQSLGYRYVDSGALYRVVAWQARQIRLDPADREALAQMLVDFRPQVTAASQGFHVAVAGRDITQELRTPEVTQSASLVATQPQVRHWVNQLLQNLARDGGVVAEGRDLGSVVFPDAAVKFFLDADLATRASRRQKEWQNSGGSSDLSNTQSDIAARDHRDKTRGTAPLAVPQGAHYLDTTNLQPEEVVTQCLAIIRESPRARAVGI
ncbi:MAG: (d)CMP kinase [Syntrophobacterales bacterium]